MNLEEARTLAHHAERCVSFDGNMNCRDLGGLPTIDGGTTRRGRIYRSGRLSNLTDEDLVRFTGLGIKALCDLRLPFECANYPNRLPTEKPPVEHHHGYLPKGAMDMFNAINAATISPEGVIEGMTLQYADMATGHPAVHAALCRHLIEPENRPLLIHCSGGKDRTGVAVAILLRAAGVSREVVAADYLLTNLDVPPLGVIGPNVTPEVAGVVGRAHTVLIEAALDAIENAYSSYEDFLCRGVGLSAAEFASLRAVLISDD